MPLSVRLLVYEGCAFNHLCACVRQHVVLCVGVRVCVCEPMSCVKSVVSIVILFRLALVLIVVCVLETTKTHRHANLACNRCKSVHASTRASVMNDKSLCLHKTHTFKNKRSVNTHVVNHHAQRHCQRMCGESGLPASLPANTCLVAHMFDCR